MEKLSWDAVRNGEIYCAPACGANCTHDEYLKAHANADLLIEKFENEIGGKWKKNIWENLGWHYSVSLVGGNITIHENKETYDVFGFNGSSPSSIHVNDTSTSIKELIHKQLKKVKEEADKYNTYLTNNMKALHIKKNIDMLIIKIENCIDIITNSSSELFVIKADKKKEIIYEMVKDALADITQIGLNDLEVRIFEGEHNTYEEDWMLNDFLDKIPEHKREEIKNQFVST